MRMFCGVPLEKPSVSVLNQQVLQGDGESSVLCSGCSRRVALFYSLDDRSPLDGWSEGVFPNGDWCLLKLMSNHVDKEQ
jgi:hypothetical protein